MAKLFLSKVAMSPRFAVPSQEIAFGAQLIDFCGSWLKQKFTLKKGKTTENNIVENCLQSMLLPMVAKENSATAKTKSKATELKTKVHCLVAHRDTIWVSVFLSDPKWIRMHSKQQAWKFQP